MNRVTLRRRFAEFIYETDYSSLPDDVTGKAKACLLDLIGVAIAGSRQPTSALAAKVIGGNAPPDEATVWVSNNKVSLTTAAFLNAVQGHAIDMDDGHRFANGHPGVLTVPTAVSLSEGLNLNGRQMLAAIVIGYEIFIRLGMALNPALLQRGFHTTATIGTFAAAAVAAKLLRLSESQIENALSLAGLQSAGLLEALSSGEMGKSFQVGRAVQSGVLAALLAKQGADGPENVFEGAKGFFKAFSGRDCDIDSICANLGAQYQIKDVYFKRHAACRHIHSALDAIEAIIKEHEIDRAAIQAIEIDTYTIAKNLTGHHSTNGGELAAKFSMPVAIGLLLVFGRTDAVAFRQEYISDPRVQSIAEKVSIRINDAWDAVYPGQRGASVRFQTKDETLTKEVIYPKGEPEFPLSSEELVGKFETNAGLVYSHDDRKKLREIINTVEHREGRDLTRMLRLPQLNQS